MHFLKRDDWVNIYSEGETKEMKLTDVIRILELSMCGRLAFPCNMTEAVGMWDTQS